MPRKKKQPTQPEVQKQFQTQRELFYATPIFFKDIEGSEELNKHLLKHIKSWKKRDEKGGHYDWHVDTGNAVCHRKLSFTIQLSDSKDYEGGDIEFIGSKVDTKAFRQKGVCIIYPSFLPHRITKVTKGVRHAIVGWIHGPTFK